MYSTHGSATRHYKTLHAFGNTIREIADVDREVTAADLLATPPFKTISYNPDKNIIPGFTKQWMFTIRHHAFFSHFAYSLIHCTRELEVTLVAQ